MSITTSALNHCWLCGPDRFSLNRHLGFPGEDTRVGHWQYWDLAVDIAPLTDGHLLASPQRHLNRFHELSQPEELELGQILAWLTSIWDCEGKDLVAFEHCSTGKVRRQCVSHAHVHVLPINRADVAKIEAMLAREHRVELGSTGGTLVRDETLTSDHIRLFFRGEWHIEVGDAVAERLRTDIEILVGGNSRSWRDRLIENEDSLRHSVLRTQQIFGNYV